MASRRKLQYRLRELRIERGLSQMALAHQAGCSDVFVSLVERGINQPSSAMLVAFAEALNVPIDELIAEPSPSPQNSAAQ